MLEIGLLAKLGQRDDLHAAFKRVSEVPGVCAEHYIAIAEKLLRASIGKLMQSACGTNTTPRTN